MADLDHASPMQGIRDRWAREDAFIGPQLPKACSFHHETRADRDVFPHYGKWWFRPHGSVRAEGPFPSIIDARVAPLPGEAA